MLEHIHHLPSTTITHLFGGENNLPHQDQYSPSSTEVTYKTFAQRDLVILLSSNGKILATPGAIDGKLLTELHHFSAPSKKYGRDEHDTHGDWHDLYENPLNAKRLKAHRRMEGWDEYEKNRELLLTQIDSAYGFSQTHPAIIVPVLSLSMKNEGSYEWDFSNVKKEEREILLQQLSHSEGNEIILLTALGPLVVAAYSPNITKDWVGTSGRRTYNGHRVPAGSYEGQDIGSTQILPLTIGESEMF